MVGYRISIKIIVRVASVIKFIPLLGASWLRKQGRRCSTFSRVRVRFVHEIVNESFSCIGRKISRRGMSLCSRCRCWRPCALCGAIARARCSGVASLGQRTGRRVETGQDRRSASRRRSLYNRWATTQALQTISAQEMQHDTRPFPQYVVLITVMSQLRLNPVPDTTIT